MSQIRVAGAGGQGILFLGTILGEAGFIDNKNVSVGASYGVQSRGGSSKSEVIISDEEILFPLVEDSDLLMVLSQDGYDENILHAAQNSLVIYDSSRVNIKDPEKQLKHHAIPATDIALEKFETPLYANILILGYMVKTTGIVSKEAVENALKSKIAKKLLTNNLEAFNLGYKYEIHSE